MKGEQTETRLAGFFREPHVAGGLNAFRVRQPLRSGYLVSYKLALAR